ncbi:MAG: glycosyltransferase [Mycobacteriales bacterium]
MSLAAAPVTIDVVICTYNNAAGLTLTLATLAAQQSLPLVSWRVCVVDNNCTDATAQVLDRHVRTGALPHLRVVRETIQGLTPARHRGVTETAGSWIAFVDDDCSLADDWVLQAGRFAADHPDCGAFGGRVMVDWQAPPPGHVRRNGWLFAEQDLGGPQREVTWLVGAGMVLSRAAVVSSGWFDQPLLEDRVGTRLISGGDVEITTRIRAAGYPLWYVPACVLRHRIPATRTSRDYVRRLSRGLGTSAVLVDAVNWPGPRQRWLPATVLACLRRSRWLARRWLGSIGRQSADREDSAVHIPFAYGQWLGIWRLVRSRVVRRTLIGAAVRDHKRRP